MFIDSARTVARSALIALVIVGPSIAAAIAPEVTVPHCEVQTWFEGARRSGTDSYQLQPNRTATLHVSTGTPRTYVAVYLAPASAKTGAELAEAIILFEGFTNAAGEIAFVADIPRSLRGQRFILQAAALVGNDIIVGPRLKVAVTQ